jgi:hypothetical protein
MEDVLSIILIAVLLVLIVVSVTKQRRTAAGQRDEAATRAGSGAAQYERSMRSRAEVRQAHLDAKEKAPAGSS